MPNVPGTKIWIRNKELNATCEAIEKAPPMERLPLSYDLAVATIHRQKKGMNSAKRTSDFIISWWFNMGHLGFPYGRPGSPNPAPAAQARKQCVDCGDTFSSPPDRPKARKCDDCYWAPVGP